MRLSFQKLSFFELSCCQAAVLQQNIDGGLHVGADVQKEIARISGFHGGPPAG